MPSARTILRRSCYAALPVAAVLIVPGFWLMPNYQYSRALPEADLYFVVGFGMSMAGVALAIVSVLLLVLIAEE